MDFREGEKLVKAWGRDKGILANSDAITQLSKTEEEVAELREALLMKKNGIKEYVNSKGKVVQTEEEIKDGYGDVIVTLFLGSHFEGVDLLDALEMVIGVITKRKGAMIDGKFVKDA